MASPQSIFNEFSDFVEVRSKGRLLDPQLNALRSLQEFFAQNLDGRIALVSMPTGSGKSGVISCLPYFLGKSGPNGIPCHSFDKPVLVIAPYLPIALQLEGVLTIAPDAPGENFLIKNGIVPKDKKRAIIPKGIKIEETRHIKNLEFLESKDVIIANAQKFLEANWEDKLPDDIFKLVIVDEAHHHPAKTWRRIISKFKGQAMVVFFTATPFRGDGQPVIENDEREMVYRLSLEDARRDQIIRRTKWIEIPGGQGELDDIFTIILNRVMVMQQAKNERNPLPGNIPHMAIAITEHIDEAKLVTEMWNNHWDADDPNSRSAIAYNSSLGKSKNKGLMEKIKNNEVKLLVIVGMLLEGFDHPPISIAAIMKKIGSPVVFAQFIGRAQRIVRVPEVESEGICADIVTHSHFQQEKNYNAFENEALIPDK